VLRRQLEAELGPAALACVQQKYASVIGARELDGYARDQTEVPAGRRADQSPSVGHHAGASWIHEHVGPRAAGQNQGVILDAVLARRITLWRQRER